MSWLYLFFGVGCAWLTYNAFRPRSSPPLAAALSFAAGLVASELPLHLLGVQVLVALVFAVLGVMGTGPGMLGFFVNLVSWAGLGVLAYQSWHAREPAESALRSALGYEYPTRILPELDVTTSDDELSWRRVLAFIPFLGREVERLRDIRYASAGGIDLHLDIYRGREAQVGCPVLLQIHGGAWTEGYGSRRGQAIPLIRRMVKHGWLCVAIEYRLSPTATFPEHLVDVKRALCWVKDNIARYGGDPEFVVATGGSAGGHLCAMLGLTADDAEYQPGFEAADTRVRGCVPFYGVFDLTNRHHSQCAESITQLVEQDVMKGTREEIPEQWDRASPITRVRPDAPPFYILHGANDSMVPVDQARQFAAALGEKSHATVAYAEFPLAQHGFDVLPTVRAMHAVGAVHRFLNVLYGDYLRERDLVGP